MSEVDDCGSFWILLIDIFSLVNGMLYMMIRGIFIDLFWCIEFVSEVSYWW